MKNKLLITIIVILILIILTWTFNILNSNKTLEWNTIDNMLINWNKLNTNLWEKEPDEIPFDWYNEGMNEHCKMMPEMKGCEKYVMLNNEDKNFWVEVGINNVENYTHHNDLYSLAEAKKSEIIELKDGDSYEMIASIVKQEVWNRTVKRLAYRGLYSGNVTLW